MKSLAIYNKSRGPEVLFHRTWSAIESGSIYLLLQCFLGNLQGCTCAIRWAFSLRKTTYRFLSERTTDEPIIGRTAENTSHDGQLVAGEILTPETYKEFYPQVQVKLPLSELDDALFDADIPSSFWAYCQIVAVPQFVARLDQQHGKYLSHQGEPLVIGDYYYRNLTPKTQLHAPPPSTGLSPEEIELLFGSAPQTSPRMIESNDRETNTSAAIR